MLNKAHVQSLEHWLIRAAKTLNRCRLLNANTPAAPSLSAEDAADCEIFLQEVCTLCAALGLTLLETTDSSAPQQAPFVLRYENLMARGHESTEGFVALQGSQASAETTSSVSASIISLREELKKNQVLLLSDAASSRAESRLGLATRFLSKLGKATRNESLKRRNVPWSSPLSGFKPDRVGERSFELNLDDSGALA